MLGGGDEKRILAQIDHSKEGATLLIDKLKQQRGELNDHFKEAPAEHALKLLTDLCRYRLHLKYFRLAHRVFNRLNVIVDPQKIQLARAGGNLYRLMDSEEVKEVADEEPGIAHHAILKADVRGSTTVTQELINQGLNPASYFSMRFFGPITERLSTYGAVKVFIEGDAVILGFYELEGDPSEWYGVARACGMAKEMIDIVGLKNTDSQKTGLPLLEIGIGICYLDERPLFLFDENRPIMISPAIGSADRMSSCSWELRTEIDSAEFNVDVLKIDVGEGQGGEKGNKYLRYNVNGVTLDHAAFEKLQSEISLTRVRLKLGERREYFMVGRFPDATGKERDLVVRDGVVGRWRQGSAERGTEIGERFYEVLPNSKLATQVIAAAKKQVDAEQ